MAKSDRRLEERMKFFEERMKSLVEVKSSEIVNQLPKYV